MNKDQYNTSFVLPFEEGKKQKVDLPEETTRNINSKTIPGFCKLLKSTSWSNVLTQQNPKIAFENFFEIFNSARDLSFPEVKVKQKPTRFKHSPWMSQGLKISQKRKEKLFARKLKCPNKDNIDKFTTKFTIN